MKIVQFVSFGTPHEVTDCLEVPDVGSPLDDEVIVEVEAFPINPVDLLTIKGHYAVKPLLPATLGAEGVGRVTATGTSVSNLAVGDRVILLGRDNWAQQRKVKSHHVLKVPKDVDVLQLAMLKVNPATALLMLRDYIQLDPGDWVIQDAANSGVGHYLIQLAKTDCIRTVNVVRRETLIGPLKAAGADVVVVDGDDLPKHVRSETDDAQIKLGLDAIAGDICIRLADCLADGATLVNYGLLSGKACMLRPDQTVFHGITLTGFWLAKVLPQMSHEAITALYADLAQRIASGNLHANVEATYPIEDISAALEHAARTGRSGKILVTPNGPLPSSPPSRGRG
ncbi:MAG: zinc-dependent alcohol dehydrogenase family protein [Acidiferrobacterales bacterium]